MQLAGYLVAGGMAYGAIRADLKALHEKAQAAHEAAARAHTRMDDHIDKHHVRQ
jgi:outer membrane murein-binding lipoprotein Lpp